MQNITPCIVFFALHLANILNANLSLSICLLHFHILQLTIMKFCLNLSGVQKKT